MVDDDYADQIEALAKSLADEAKLGLEDARKLALEYGPLVFRWQAEANAADAAGNAPLAKKRRMSIKHVRNAVVLDVAARGVAMTSKVERAILALFDKALTAL